MISKKNTGRAFGFFLATGFATLITNTVYAWHVPVVLTSLVFIGLWIGFYFAGVWALNERPAELAKKFPIASNELRRRKKEFYDWLASQGRR